jgi:hypothetical protein
MTLAREGERTLATYVALLRGINVGGRTRVSMADLRTLFLALGSEDVATYVQSGNVLFKAPLAGPAELAPPIEEEIRRRLGLNVRVVVRTAAQLAQVVAGNPFAADEIDPGSFTSPSWPSHPTEPASARSRRSRSSATSSASSASMCTCTTRAATGRPS